MKRRHFLAGSGALLATPAIAQKATVLKMVPQANLTSFDPVWTTANISRNHGYMVFDTLYGLNADLAPQPQMAAGAVTEDDGRSVTITLRDGVAFHDGQKVLARDCVASIKRWMKRSPYGQRLDGVTDELAALDDTRLRFRLKQPFPLLTNALAAIGPGCMIMPERIAATDPFKQIPEVIGSGPFRFVPGEFNSGSLVVYEKNAAYVPRPDGVTSLTAGPKRVFFDRVEWHIITDAATSAAALQNGEIDWFEQPPPEIQAALRRRTDVKVSTIDPKGLLGVMRFNFLHPPFDDVKIRRAVLPAISQAEFMQSVVGPDPASWSDGVGVFTPGTPMANDAGMDALRGTGGVARARAMLKEAGYHDQLARLIGPTDILAPSAMTQVAAALLPQTGLNMDIALSDWGTVIQRRTSREPLDKGGWSTLLTSFSSFDFADPAAHPLVRGNGASAWFGWPTIPKLEDLRGQWFAAPDLPSRQAICRDIQRTVIDEVAYVPLGMYQSYTALRANLVDRVTGFAIFWGLRRA